jgi:hypothetical protein
LVSVTVDLIVSEAVGRDAGALVMAALNVAPAPWRDSTATTASVLR